MSNSTSALGDIPLDAPIYVAGHQGMVGAAIIRALKKAGCTRLITRTHAELDLTDQAAVRGFFGTHAPRYIFLAAAKVGGINANNTYPADFIYQNLMIEANVIEAAFSGGVERLLFLGSSCIYPRLAPQPMGEAGLLTGPLEATNEPYAIAKIAGIKLCESYNRQHGTDFRSVMPTNLYGPGDNFDLDNSHVVPALIRKFHDAKQELSPAVKIWGTGTPKRELLHVDDMANACVYLMSLEPETYSRSVAPMQSHLNLGTGDDVSIAELANTIADIVGFAGTLEYDTSKPDGTPRKLLDVSRLSALGWKARITLREGLKQTYKWFLDNQADLRQ